LADFFVKDVSLKWFFNFQPYLTFDLLLKQILASREKLLSACVHTWTTFRMFAVEQQKMVSERL